MTTKTRSDHYRQGDVECIDAIRSALTPSEFIGFCKGNVLKYVWRERNKGGSEDVEKAIDYIKWLYSAVLDAESALEASDHE